MKTEKLGKPLSCKNYLKTIKKHQQKISYVHLDISWIKLALKKQCQKSNERKSSFDTKRPHW